MDNMEWDIPHPYVEEFLINKKNTNEIFQIKKVKYKCLKNWQHKFFYMKCLKLDSGKIVYFKFNKKFKWKKWRMEWK